jgi:serine/threonine protein kinase
MAPEINSGKPYQGPPVDVFALGAVLFIMKTARFAFGEYGDKLYRRFQRNPLDAMKERKIEISDPDFLDLVAGMTRRDADDRFTLEKVMRHPYM